MLMAVSPRLDLRVALSHVQGNSGTTIVGSPGATVHLGRQNHTDFVLHNAFHILIMGTYATGKVPVNTRQQLNHMTVNLFNEAIRPIEQIRLAIYPDD
jgi:hypothetical protein